MTFGKSISTCFSKYATFSGRASRSEYWWWQLFAGIIGFIAYFILVGKATHDTLTSPGMMYDIDSDPGFSTLGGVVFGIIWLVLLLPSLAVLFRRLHDTGRSGWWFLLNFIPIANIAVLVFTLLPTEPSDNKYGPVPEGVYNYPPANRDSQY